jgi:ribokinase
MKGHHHLIGKLPERSGSGLIGTHADRISWGGQSWLPLAKSCMRAAHKDRASIGPQGNGQMTQLGPTTAKAPLTNSQSVYQLPAAGGIIRLADALQPNRKGPAMPDRPVVLVVGSLHHDIMVEADHLPRVDETAVGRRWYPKFGGKGGNQAVAAQTAGGNARMFGAVGQDGFGTFLLAALEAGGVDHRFVRSLKGVGSGMSVAIQDRAGDYAATIVSGANLMLDPTELDDPALWDGVKVLILQNEIAEAVNIAAAHAAQSRGVTVILNAAPARKLPQELRVNIDILVVNAVEAEMSGTEPVKDLPSALAAANHLAAQYKSVVVTAGAKGLAACAAEDAPFTLPAQKVTVASTHGAGDCFTGALAAALAQGEPLASACRSASNAAARHVSGTAATAAI